MKEINTNAPVHLIETVLINATPQQVWDVMTGVDSWPDWQKNITKAALEGDLTTGHSFTMTNAGDEIKAMFHTVTPYQFFGWESHYNGLDVTHNWTLIEQEGKTLVKDEEGMEGAFAEAGKAGLQASIEKSKPEWLTYLKQEVERRTNHQLNSLTMKFKNNKEVVEYFGNGFVTGNDLTIYEEIVAKDFADHATPNGGYQSMLDTFQAMRAAMPDMTLVIHKLIEDDDCVACLKSLVGHHTGADIFGAAATGSPMQIDLIDILRIQNNQFVENWVYNNTAEVMSALQQKRPIANLLTTKSVAL